MKVSKARKTSQLAKSPLKKRRARMIAKYRTFAAGSGKSPAKTQLSSELKLLSKTSKLSVCEGAGVKKKAVFKYSQQMALKSALSLSWSQTRTFKRFCRTSGIQYDSEKRERSERRNLLQENTLTSELILMWHKDEKAPDSVYGMVQRPTPAVYIKDLKTLVTNRLNEYDAAGSLSWEGFPDDEVYVKVGGDHGGGSFKLCLQIANVLNPNAKQNTIVIGCFEAKDNAENLKTILLIFKESLKKLTNMQWKGKKIRVLVFGDYAFLSAAYGLSGASGTHPCVWCYVKKEDMKLPTRNIQLRTLQEIKADHKRFVEEGRQDKKKAAQYHNAIRAPLLAIEVSHVCPPYLHILLGVVKMHHDLLETGCHEIDKSIADDVASTFKSPVNPSKYEDYIVHRKRVLEIEKSRTKLMQELQFERKSCDLAPEQTKALKEEIKKEIRRIEQLLSDAKEVTLDKISGPVTANLSAVLMQNKIVIQAFHSRSFTGNHCAKYLRPPVYQQLTSSIEIKTKAYTENQNIILEAETLGFKFSQLNALYSELHQLISHSKPIPDDQIPELEVAISHYLGYFRKTFPSIFPPKMHMLEDHVVPWIRRFGFGMGLLGEQGGEGCHREFNRLKRVMHAIPNRLMQLTSIMKEHIILTHPKINVNIPKAKKRQSSALKKDQA
jgi:hypothetical protein